MRSSETPSHVSSPSESRTKPSTDRHDSRGEGTSPYFTSVSPQAQNLAALSGQRVEVDQRRAGGGVEELRRIASRRREPAGIITHPVHPGGDRPQSAGHLADFSRVEID